MSRRDVDEYFDKVATQYCDMLSEIRDFEKEASEGLIEPERFDEIKKVIEPLKNNYERWSYMMFLLNKPSRKSKEKRYISANKKLLSSIDKNNTADAVMEENNKVLKEINNKGQ